MIFLVTLFISLATVTAADSSTLINDDVITTQGSEDVSSVEYITKEYTTKAVEVQNNTLNNNVETSEKSNLESNDILSKSENLESKQEIQTTKTNMTTRTSKKSSKTTPIITLNPVKTTNNNIQVNAMIKLTNGKNLNNALAVLKINGVTYKKTTVNNGVASFNLNVPGLTAKNYTLTVKIGQTEETNEAEKTTTLTIVRRNLIVSFPSYTTTTNSKIKLEATVKYDNGEVVNGADVVFKINGKTIQTTTVKNGVASIEYTTPESYKNYTLLVKVGQNSYSNEISKTSNLVLTTTPKIVADRIYFVKKNSATNVVVLIKDSKGKNINNGKVSFKINGVTVDVVKVVNGAATLKYKATMSKQINNLTVVFSAENLQRVEAKSTLRVQSMVAGFTYEQVLKKANDTKVFIEKNKRIPNFITFGNYQVSPEDFLFMLCEVYDTNRTYEWGDFVKGGTGSTNCYNEKIYKADYVELAKGITKSYIQNGRAQISITVNKQTMSFNDALYFYTRAVAYIYNNGMCSSYGTVLSISQVLTGDNSDPILSNGIYLKSTKNCQVGSINITAATNAAIKNVKGTYNKAVAIFEYVKDKTSYSGYSNTRYGAEKTLRLGYGNCCDMAHLIIAMMRTAGIQARYNHATCYFSSGLVTGHVWAEVYVDGKWYNCDATSNRNTFGNIKNWNGRGPLKVYAELPF